MFWQCVDAADRLVVWFSAATANDLSFFHMVCDRLEDRSFDIVQMSGPVGAQSADDYRRLLSDARPVTGIERDTAQQAWRRLRQENSVFRVLAPAGLVSAPEDHYDAALLDTAGSTGTALGIVVGTVMSTMNVSDLPLFWRAAVLQESGALIADGDWRDPWRAPGTRVRRA